MTGQKKKNGFLFHPGQSTFMPNLKLEAAQTLYKIIEPHSRNLTFPQLQSIFLKVSLIETLGIVMFINNLDISWRYILQDFILTSSLIPKVRRHPLEVNCQ